MAAAGEVRVEVAMAMVEETVEVATAAVAVGWAEDSRVESADVLWVAHGVAVAMEMAEVEEGPQVAAAAAHSTPTSPWTHRE